MTDSMHPDDPTPRNRPDADASPEHPTHPGGDTPDRTQAHPGAQAPDQTRSYPPSVDDLTVVRPLGTPPRSDATAASDPIVSSSSNEPTAPRISPERPPAQEHTAYPEGRLRWGPSMPTVLAGMLLIAVSAGVAFLRLADTTQAPSAAAVILVAGAVLIISGLLVLLVGHQRAHRT